MPVMAIMTGIQVGGKSSFCRNCLSACDRVNPKKLAIPSYKEGFDELYFVRITDTGTEVEKWQE